MATASAPAAWKDSSRCSERPDRRLGTLYIRADTSALYARFWLWGAIAAAAMVASLLLAYFLSRIFQAAHLAARAVARRDRERRVRARRLQRARTVDRRGRVRSADHGVQPDAGAHRVAERRAARDPAGTRCDPTQAAEPGGQARSAATGHARDRRAPGSGQHLPSRRAQPRRQRADRLRMHVHVRRDSTQAHGREHRPEGHDSQRAAADRAGRRAADRAERPVALRAGRAGLRARHAQS